MVMDRYDDNQNNEIDASELGRWHAESKCTGLHSSDNYRRKEQEVCQHTL